MLVGVMAVVAGLVVPAHGSVLPEDTPTYTLYAPVRASGAETLLVVFPGGNLPASSQTRLVKAVQAASDQRLWVGVAKFTGNLATPAEGQARIAQITAAVAAEGFTSVSPQRTFLAGHSLGGVMASITAQANDVRGVLLWAAYVPNLPGLPGLAQYPRPVLTMGGSLDGRSRVTRTAQAYDEAFSSGAGYDAVVRRKPVVVIDGANHSSFGDGEPLSNDLPAELTTGAAHARIAAVSAAFLDVNALGVPASDAAAGFRVLADEAGKTGNDTAEFRFARVEERGDYCEAAQRTAAGQVPQSDQRLTIANTVTADADAFARTPPSIDPAEERPVRVLLRTASRTVQEDHTGDQPSVPVSAAKVGCRMNSSAAVTDALGEPRDNQPPDCAALNADRFRTMMWFLTPDQRRRFLTSGRDVRFTPDRVVASPAALADAGVVFDAGTPRSLSITSTRYDAAGERSCQLVSPARLVEIALFDALK